MILLEISKYILFQYPNVEAKLLSSYIRSFQNYDVYVLSTESLTVPGVFNENVNIKKTFMEKHQVDVVIGIGISFVLVVICVYFIIKLHKIKKKKATEFQYQSSYVACPLNSMGSSHDVESLFCLQRQ